MIKSKFDMMRLSEEEHRFFHSIIRVTVCKVQNPSAPGGGKSEGREANGGCWWWWVVVGVASEGRRPGGQPKAIAAFGCGLTISRFLHTMNPRYGSRMWEQSLERTRGRFGGRELENGKSWGCVTNVGGGVDSGAVSPQLRAGEVHRSVHSPSQKGPKTILASQALDNLILPIF